MAARPAVERAYRLTSLDDRFEAHKPYLQATLTRDRIRHERSHPTGEGKGDQGNTESPDDCDVITEDERSRRIRGRVLVLPPFFTGRVGYTAAI
jgi:hypothetical protein